eukprot:Colp12_sorted_trinity150504_noHs@25276
MKLIAFLALALGVALAHPTFYDVAPKAFGPGNLPPIRSFHVHVMFQKEHRSDACTGYDDAMLFRNLFMKTFNISQVDCAGDFDQGRLCMFPTALGPFGPFLAPQWAAFVPLEDYPAISQWMMQNRGQFDVFIHPNTGFERNDHKDWGVWGGRPYPLDLTADEFEPTLPALYPTSCRNEAPIFDIPTGYEEGPEPGTAHIRVFNAQTAKDSSIVFSFRNNTGAFKFPALAALDQTWYLQFPTSADPVTISALTRPAPQRIKLPGLAADSWHTVIYTKEGNVMHYEDDNIPNESLCKVRFVNLLGPATSVSIRRDGKTVISNLAYQGVSQYDLGAQGIAYYDIVDEATGRVVLTEPYYLNAGTVISAFLVGGRPSRENPDSAIVLIQDFPHDAPSTPHHKG